MPVLAESERKETEMAAELATIALEPSSIDQPVRDAYLIFGSPRIFEPEINEVVATLRSGWLGTGPRVAALEDKFRDYIGALYALAVNSCTAALHPSMRVIGLEPGDEVVVPSMTLMATANAVIHAGGKPVLADVDRRTMCVDPENAARRITPRTRAIIPVHFAGRACEMTCICDLATSHGLRLWRTAPMQSKRSTTAGMPAFWAIWEPSASTSPRT